MPYSASSFRLDSRTLVATLVAMLVLVAMAAGARAQTVPSPTANSPTDGASLYESQLPVTLDWSTVSEADIYDVEIATSAGFGSTNVISSTTTSSGYSTSNLSPGTTYYWRVRAVAEADAGGDDGFGFETISGGGGSGGESYWTPARMLTVRYNPPSTPSLLSPSAGATNVDWSPTLDWSNSTGRVDNYRVQVRMASQSWSQASIYTPTVSQKALSGLNPATTYYWRVRGENVSGPGSWSNARSFTTVVPPPRTPPMVSPADEATNQPTTLALKWDPSSGTVDQYHVEWKPRGSTHPWSSANTHTTSYTSVTISSLDRERDYNWRVRAENAGGFSDWDYRGFSTIPNPPGTPPMVSPADGAIDLPTTLTLDWDPSSGVVDQYRVEWKRRGSLHPWSSANTQTTGNTSVTISGLDAERDYNWRVRAENAGGNSNWDYRGFTTAPNPPGTPSLLSPSGNASDQPTSLTLDWSNVSGEVDRYRVQWKRSSQSWSNATTATPTSSQKGISSLSRETTYNWRVRAENAGGNSSWAYRSFSTLPNAPGTPSLISPSDNASDQNLYFTFSWQDASGRVDTYRIQVRRTGQTWTDGSTYTASSSSRTITGFAANQTYEWRVRAENDGGNGPWSNTWRFTTRPEPPSTPSLISPSGNASDQPTSLTLDWSNASGVVDRYRVQWKRSSQSWSNATTATPISSQKSISSLSRETTYDWRVRAENAGGNSNWASRSFTTLPNAPGTPSLISPSDNAVDQPTSLTLDWNDASGEVDRYRVQWKRSSQSWSNATTATPTSSQKGISSLSRETTYDWRVRAENVGGNSSWASRSFTTLPNPPGAPPMVSPADGAIDLPTTLTLDWDPSSGVVDQYRVEWKRRGSLHPWSSANTQTTGNTSVTISGLDAERDYNWRVRAENAGGNSNWDYRGFTTAPNPPGTPPMESPSDGAVEQPTTLVLDWNPSSGTVEQYHVEWKPRGSTHPWSSANKHTTGNTSVTISGLDAERDYNWRVRAENAGGFSDWDYRGFTTYTPLPGATTLNSPANQAENVPTSTTLDWQAASGTVEEYRVQWKTSGQTWSQSNEATVSGTQKDLSGLPTATVYNWRVRAENNGGTGPWSAVYSFRTNLTAYAAPGSPSPVNNATIWTTDADLSWGNVSGAEGYRVQVLNAPIVGPAGPDQIVADKNTLSASRRISGLTRGTTYYWRVCVMQTVAMFDGPDETRCPAPIQWSTSSSFRVANRPPTPTNLTPNASSNQPVQQDVSWDVPSTSEVRGYEVQHRPEGGSWSATQTLTSAATQSASLPGLNRDVPYEWRVRSTHPGATSDWATASYRTIPHAAGIPQQVAPADPGPKVYPNPTLDWNDAYSAIASQDFEGSNPDWVRNSEPGHAYTDVETHSGDRAYRINSYPNCDPGCYYSTQLTFSADEVDRTGTYRFSAWVYAPSGHDAPHLQLKYEDADGWQYPTPSSYSQTGTWQLVSTTLDLSTIPTLKRVQGMIRHVGTSGNPAYIDDITIERVSGPPATAYEVDMYSVKTDGTTAEHTTSTVSSSAAQLSGLRKSTTYLWRVRGTTDGGTGPWSAYHRMQTQTMSRVADAGRLPADNDTVRIVKGGTQSFSWDPVPDATRYRIQMTEAGTGYTNAHIDTTVTATSLDLPRSVLTNGAPSTQQIDWRVRAQHDWGQGVEGATWTLSVEPAASRRYYVTDHLGSTRAVVDPSKPAGSKVIETRDYMPYGSRMPGRVSNQAPDETAEDYTGHELDGETSMHYAGARYYMSEIGRFGVRDPMSNSYGSWSPYHYAGNNPMRITDPSGKFWVDRVRSTKQVRAGRYGVVSGYTWKLPEWLASKGGLVGEFSSVTLGSIRDFSIQGAKDYSVLDESNQDWAWSGVTTLIPGDFAAGVSDLVELGSLIEMRRKLNADEIAFKAIAAADPIIRAGSSTYHLISDAGPGAFSLGLHSALEKHWGGGTDAIERFQKEIAYVRNVAIDLLQSGVSVQDATEQVTTFLEARDRGTNVKDDPEACQFVANTLEGFSENDC